MYFCTKYPLPNGKVGVIQGEKKITRKCHAENLRLKRIYTQCEKAKRISLGITPMEEFHKGEETSSLIFEGTDL